ncbi:MoaD/ThiS family protein [Natronorubrum halophilum]|uniref:MoaD/ThiS family protein n=1 Tax=Natronorubrum halophilum TaxID=1702106 RepID=UPI000EF7140A|nr:MoaD/ThiS family protein [Natronorubrum halophilum]
MDVTVYGPLRSATGEKTVSIEFTGTTVADALEAFVDAYPRATPQLYDGDEVRSSVRASIDGERAALEDPIPDGASLSLVPAVQGGSRDWPLERSKYTQRIHSSVVL